MIWSSTVCDLTAIASPGARPGLSRDTHPIGGLTTGIPHLQAWLF
jgi:hypothetical protein